MEYLPCKFIPAFIICCFNGLLYCSVRTGNVSLLLFNSASVCQSWKCRKYMEASVVCVSGLKHLLVLLQCGNCLLSLGFTGKKHTDDNSLDPRAEIHPIVHIYYDYRQSVSHSLTELRQCSALHLSFHVFILRLFFNPFIVNLMRLTRWK